MITAQNLPYGIDLAANPMTLISELDSKAFSHKKTSLPGNPKVELKAARADLSKLPLKEFLYIWRATLVIDGEKQQTKKQQKSAAPPTTQAAAATEAAVTATGATAAAPGATAAALGAVAAALGAARAAATASMCEGVAQKT
ncbi:hypothetical protein Emed_006397 [Eimeria media]